MDELWAINTCRMAMVCSVLVSPVIAAAQVDPVMPARPAVAGLYRFDYQGPRADEQRSREDEAKQRAEEAKQRESERRQRVDENYQRGQQSLERRQWARAADQFTSVIEAQNAIRVDAALYWKGYALDKLGEQADALAALGQMIKSFPQSRWLADAKALELQVRQNAATRWLASTLRRRKPTSSAQ